MCIIMHIMFNYNQINSYSIFIIHYSLYLNITKSEMMEFGFIFTKNVHKEQKLENIFKQKKKCFFVY